MINLLNYYNFSRFKTLQAVALKMNIKVYCDIYEFKDFILAVKIPGHNLMILFYKSLDYLVMSLALLVNDSFKGISKLYKREKSRKKRKLQLITLLKHNSTKKNHLILDAVKSEGMEALDKFLYYPAPGEAKAVAPGSGSGSSVAKAVDHTEPAPAPAEAPETANSLVKRVRKF